MIKKNKKKKKILLLAIITTLFILVIYLIFNRSIKKSSTVKYNSQQTGYSFSYPSSLGKPTIGLWEGVQDDITFQNHLHIILSNKGTNRGSIINGIDINEFQTEDVTTLSGLKFKIITYKVEDSDKYMLEAYYPNDRALMELIYLKYSDYLSHDQLTFKKELLKKIVKSITK